MIEKCTAATKKRSIRWSSRAALPTMGIGTTCQTKRPEGGPKRASRCLRQLLRFGSAIPA